jgi:hypothetical protein
MWVQKENLMDLGKLEEISIHRVCQECGAEFWTKKVEGQEVSALQQFSDHTTKHQMTPGQWTEAYNKIQSQREKAKK